LPVLKDTQKLESFRIQEDKGNKSFADPWQRALSLDSSGAEPLDLYYTLAVVICLRHTAIDPPTVTCDGVLLL